MACVALWGAAPALAKGGWKRVLQADGVTVSAREVPGEPQLEFRGVAVLAVDLFPLLAVIDDTANHCIWQANCKVSRVVKANGEFERWIYHRVGAPWPVSDRDVVIRGTVQIDAERRAVWSHFRDVTLPSLPPVKGVVRLPKLVGFYKLEWLADDRTRVTYQVSSRTGGLLPTWLANRAARGLPHGTLVGLRKRAKAMAGKYEAFHRRFNPAKGGTIPLLGRAPGKVPDTSPAKKVPDTSP
jgi:hypothetical protein